MKMNKFKSALKKELIIYISIIMIFIILGHSDLFTNPSARFELMATRGNYFHPFIYSFAIYSVIFIIRKLIDFIGNLFQKKSQ